MKKGVLFVVIFITGFVMFSSIFNIIGNEKRITGKTSVSEGRIMLFVEGDFQAMPLYEGWNFISFYVEMENYSISNIMSSISGYYDYILEWNTANQEFRTWSRYGTEEFTEMNKNKSYFVYMNEDRNLTIGGLFFANYSIPVSIGWETPNYVYEYVTNIPNNTFYNVTFDYMQKWQRTNQEFIVYSYLSAEPDFRNITGGEGYFILTEGGRLVYVRGA